jgi:hypothetical protein
MLGKSWIARKTVLFCCCTDRIIIDFERQTHPLVQEKTPMKITLKTFMTVNKYTISLDRVRSQDWIFWLEGQQESVGPLQNTKPIAQNLRSLRVYLGAVKLMIAQLIKLPLYRELSKIIHNPLYKDWTNRSIFWAEHNESTVMYYAYLQNCKCCLNIWQWLGVLTINGLCTMYTCKTVNNVNV